MTKIIIDGPTPEFEQLMKKKISSFIDELVIVDCKIECSYDSIKSGECECWNQKQDEQPGHPEFG